MTNHMLEQLTAIDPHPVDADPPTGAVTAAAVLRELEWRSTMQTLEKKTTSKPPSRWNGALVAAVAAAAILVIGVTAAWLTSSGTDEPTATTTTEATTPTSTASDSAASISGSREFEFVSAMGVDLSNGDTTRILTTVDAETVFGVTDGGSPIRSVEDLENFLTYGIALESTWVRGVCTMGSGNVATCELVRSSDAESYAGVDAQVMLVHLHLDGDRATNFSIEFTAYGADNWLTRELAFMAWLEESYPDDYAVLYARPASDGVWAPDWSDPAAAAALMRQRVSEYLSSAASS